MERIKHLLKFKDNRVLEIIEPVGFDGVSVSLKTAKGRKGRDVLSMLSGQGLQLNSFVPEHHFKEVYNEYRRYGNETDIRYIFSINGENYELGQLSQFKTDDVSYINFIVQDPHERASIKINSDTETNLFSSKTLFKTDIEPVQLQRVFVPAKPSVQQSTWKWNQPTFNTTYVSYGRRVAYLAPFPQIDKYDIHSTVSPFTVFSDADNVDEEAVKALRKEVTLIRARKNLSNIKVEIKGLNLRAITTGERPYIFIRMSWGTSYDAGALPPAANKHDFFSAQAYNVNLVNKNYEYTIPYVPINGYISLSVIFFYDGLPSVTPQSSTEIRYSAGSLTMTATETGYNTVIPMVRLYDAMQYNLASATNFQLSLSAPRWAAGGEFYNQFITNGTLMRNLTDKPFNITFEQIVSGYLPEVNGDYQVSRSNELFYGAADKYGDDFYMIEEIANFVENDEVENVEPFECSPNQDYENKNFSFKYSKYQSKKETDVDGTFDSPHGEAKFYNQNTYVYETKEVSVDFVRDAFLADQTIQKAIEVTENTATQEDSTIFIYDVVPFTNIDERYITQTFQVQHTASQSFLTLTNDGSFNWQLLGIETNTFMQLLTGANSGLYLVVAVLPNQVRIRIESAPDYPQDIPEEITLIKYFVSNSVTLKVRTNEGLSIIDGFSTSLDYPNLLYTVKRNIVERYGKFLATCAYYAGDKSYTNSLYQNNPNAATQPTGGDLIIEGAEFTPSNPILKPELYTATLIMPFSEVITYIEAVQRKRGYITVLGKNGHPLKGFTTSFEWKPLAPKFNNDGVTGEVTVIFEAMNDNAVLSIFADNGIVIINDKVMPSGVYGAIKEEELYIYEESGLQLLPPVWYKYVTINGTNYENLLTFSSVINTIMG